MKIQNICEDFAMIGNSMDVLDAIYDKLGPFGVKVKYEKIERIIDGNSHWSLGRVVLSGDRNKQNSFTMANVHSTYIIDSTTWTITSVFPKMCQSSPQQSKINNILNSQEYTLSKIIDGTIINLYFFNGKWNMATSTSYDLTGKKWIGDSTYFDVFMNVCNDGMKQEFGTNFENLDTTSCYNFIMRSHEFHPFLHDPEGLTFVNRVDLKTLEVISINPFETIPSQQIVEHSFQTYDEMKESLKASFQTAVNGGDVNYGYIIHPTDQTQPNIMVESELLQKIRYHAYFMPNALKNILNETNREKFRIINNVIHSQSYSEFLSLFPQYAQTHTEYKTCLDTITKIIVDKLKNPKKEIKHPLVPMTKKILDSICRRENLMTLKYGDVNSVVHNYVYNTYYISVYLQL